MAARPYAKLAQERDRLRQVVAEHAPLVALLRELYPPSMPALNASDREIGAFVGEQRLIERLEVLIAEARGPAADGGLRKVL